MKDIPTLGWPNAPQGWHARTGGYAKDMFLRDYFAAKAMRGMFAAKDFPTGIMSDTAKEAYNMADAMLEVRNAA